MLIGLIKLAGRINPYIECHNNQARSLGQPCYSQVVLHPLTTTNAVRQMVQLLGPRPMPGCCCRGRFELIVSPAILCDPAGPNASETTVIKSYVAQ